MTGTTVARTSARVAARDRDLAMRLAATEYDRFLELLRALGPEDWARPTDCPGWDVRAMAGHTLGMTEMTGSLRRFAGQNAAAARGGGGVDALTAHQVRTRSSLSTAELIERFAAAGPRAVRGRRRLAGIVGGLPLPAKQVVGGEQETWRFGFLLDVILTRDPWMHRVDISRATGRDLVLTPEHDGRLVADVVAEWARRHGKPFTLELTGPAGGSWSRGDDAEELDLDAVEFCRLLSGRGSGEGLLAVQVPF